MPKKITTLSLTIPIFIETLLRTLLMSADTVMLSRFSDEGVAAVSMVQTFGFFILVIYLMASTGASIYISQYLGAKKSEEASKTAQAALINNITIGVILSLSLNLAAPFIIKSLALEPLVELYALQYFKIYTAFSIFQATSLVFATIIRSYGYSYTPMYVNFAANILNVIGNYLFIFGKFGFPQLGVQGVAISTVFSQGVGAIIMAIIIRRKPEIRIFYKRNISELFVYIKDVLKVGIPSAGEMLSYNIAQISILYFVTYLGTNALASYGYTTNISRFSFMLTLALGHATQILIGYKVGEGNKDEAYKACFSNLKWGIITSFIFASFIAIFRYKIIGFLTNNTEIISITSTLLLLAIIHEIGRPINIIIINGLRGTGDVRYPVFTGIIMMWGISVPLAYFLGIHLGFAMAGIWIARIIEEWLRGIVIIRRWRSRKWESKLLIK